MDRPSNRGFEEMEVSCQFWMNDDAGSISELVVPQSQFKGFKSMVSAVMLVLLFHEYVFLGAFVIAERYKTDGAISVSFRDEAITATIKK